MIELQKKSHSVQCTHILCKITILLIRNTCFISAKETPGHWYKKIIPGNLWKQNDCVRKELEERIEKRHLAYWEKRRRDFPKRWFQQKFDEFSRHFDRAGLLNLTDAKRAIWIVIVRFDTFIVVWLRKTLKISIFSLFFSCCRFIRIIRQM